MIIARSLEDWSAMMREKRVKEIKLSERDNDANAFDKRRAASKKLLATKAINRILTDEEG